MTIERIGSEGGSGKAVFLVWARDLEDLPPQLALPCARFVLLLAHDAEAKAVRLVETLEHLPDAGCVYLCTWGAGCEHVHDMMDEVIVGAILDDPRDGTIMTTSHDKQPLIEAMDFALMWANLTSIIARVRRDCCGNDRRCRRTRRAAGFLEQSNSLQSITSTAPTAPRLRLVMINVESFRETDYHEERGRP